MDHSETDKFRVLEARYELQHARLLAPFQLRLKADEAEMIAGKRVLPKLDGRIRNAPRARIDQADRLHRTEA